MKLLLFFLLLSGLSGQAQSYGLSATASNRAISLSVSKVWTHKNWQGSLSLEYLKPATGKPFLPVLIGLNYSLGVPFVSVAAGPGWNTEGRYGAMAEGGAGVRYKLLSVGISYREIVLPFSLEEEETYNPSGLFARIGVHF